LGRIIASSNRAWQFQRQRVIPANPRTPQQQRQRGWLAAAASYWRVLTPAQQLAWDQYAKARGFTGNGFQAHNSVRLIMANTGEPFTGDPPPVAAFDKFSCNGLRAEVGGKALRLTLQDVQDPTPEVRYIVESARAGSSGRRSWDSALAIIKSPASLPELQDAAGLGRAYVAKFGLPAAGQALPVRVTQVLHGQKGLPWPGIAIVTPAS
jgi:hypothetical protein